jgi:hypothetical protein
MKSLLRENDLLNEKITAMEIDLKAILSNRQKLDYLEEMIMKFMGNNDERGLIDNIINYMNNNFSTKNKDFYFNSMSLNNNKNNYLSTNFNSVNNNNNNYPNSTYNSFNVAGSNEILLINIYYFFFIFLFFKL